MSLTFLKHTQAKSPHVTKTQVRHKFTLINLHSLAHFGHSGVHSGHSWQQCHLQATFSRRLNHKNFSVNWTIISLCTLAIDWVAVNPLSFALITFKDDKQYTDSPMIVLGRDISWLDCPERISGLAVWSYPSPRRLAELCKPRYPSPVAVLSSSSSGSLELWRRAWHW